MHERTFQALPNHLLVRKKDAGNDFGRLSTFECTQNFIGVKRHSRYVCKMPYIVIVAETRISKCTEPKCDAAFNKHHQLRDHIATLHSPPGTKPYRCERSGCTKSFATNQKLTAHAKTHDGMFLRPYCGSLLSLRCRRQAIYMCAQGLPSRLRLELDLLLDLERPPTPYQNCPSADMPIP